MVRWYVASTSGYHTCPYATDDVTLFVFITLHNSKNTTYMWQRFKRAVKCSRAHPYVLRLLKPYTYLRHQLVYRRAHHVILSFPKSGRTWARVFLSGYTHFAYSVPHTLDFAFFRRVAPDIPQTLFRHGGSEITDLKKLDRYISRFHGKHILLIVRDPRDVVVSYYHETCNRDPRFMHKEKPPWTMSEFTRDEKFGIKHVVQFMNQWFLHRDMFESLQIVRYEEMRKHPETAFRTFLDFWKLPTIDEDAFRKAIKFSSFENMRVLEQMDFFADPRVRATQKENVFTYKTRKGKVGGFREETSAEDQAHMNKAMKKLNSVYGYIV